MIEQMSIFSEYNQMDEDLMMPSDEDETKYLDYLSFKNWLYKNYPMFIDKETMNGRWEYKEITTRIAHYSKLNDER